MGGLLLINAAVKHPDKVKAVIALSLPLRLKLTARAVQNRLLLLKPPKENENAELRAARELCGVSGISALSAPRLLAGSLELLKLIRAAKKRLRLLKRPLIAINSKGDEIVSLGSLELAEREAGEFKALVLEHSSHFCFPKEDLRLAAQEINVCLARKEP